MKNIFQTSEAHSRFQKLVPAFIITASNPTSVKTAMINPPKNKLLCWDYHEQRKGFLIQADDLKNYISNDSVETKKNIYE